MPGPYKGRHKNGVPLGPYHPQESLLAAEYAQYRYSMERHCCELMQANDHLMRASRTLPASWSAIASPTEPNLGNGPELTIPASPSAVFEHLAIKALGGKPDLSEELRKPNLGVRLSSTEVSFGLLNIGEEKKCTVTLHNDGACPALIRWSLIGQYGGPPNPLSASLVASLPRQRSIATDLRALTPPTLLESPKL